MDRFKLVSDPGLFLAAGVGLQWRSIWWTLCAWDYSSLIKDEILIYDFFWYPISFTLVGILKYHQFLPRTVICLEIAAKIECHIC